MMMFTIVFGLSMDYEVFLLSRIQAEWVRTGDNSAAVSTGLAGTARVITAAAAIMVCVFGSFVVKDPLHILNVFGLGPGGGDLRRRDGRAHGAGALGDAAARDRELVASRTARPQPAAPGTSRGLRGDRRLTAARAGRRS